MIDGFTAAVQYRPLVHGRSLTCSMGPWALNLSVFKAITIVQFAGILWCLVALCRVSTGYQALAACLALSCFVGLHTSRILFGFFPLNHHSLVLMGLLATRRPGSCAHIGPGIRPATLRDVPRASPCHRVGAAAASDAGVPVVGRRTRRATSRRRLGSGRRGGLRGRAHHVQLGWRRHSLDSRRVLDSASGRSSRKGFRMRSARRRICSGYTTSWRVS